MQPQICQAPLMKAGSLSILLLCKEVSSLPKSLTQLLRRKRAQSRVGPGGKDEGISRGWIKKMAGFSESKVWLLLGDEWPMEDSYGWTANALIGRYTNEAACWVVGGEKKGVKTGKGLPMVWKWSRRKHTRVCYCLMNKFHMINTSVKHHHDVERCWSCTNNKKRNSSRISVSSLLVLGIKRWQEDTLHLKESGHQGKRLQEVKRRRMYNSKWLTKGFVWYSSCLTNKKLRVKASLYNMLR